MLFQGVFDLVVADAVEALDEHHDGGDAGERDFRRIVEGAGGHTVGGAGGFGNGLVAEGDEGFMEGNRRDLPDALPVDGAAAFFCEALAGSFCFGEHRGEGGGIEVALVEGEAALGDDAGDDAGFGFAGADGAHAAVALGDVIDFRSHFRGGEESVFAAVHGGAAGVGGLAFEGNRPALDATGAENGGKRKSEIKKNRALLDVEFEIGCGVFSLCSRIENFLEVDAAVFQGGGQRDVIAVCEGAGFFQVEVAGKGRGAEQAFPEARAFLIRPIDESDGDGRAAGVFRGDASHDLYSGHEVQAAIEPAAVGD